MNSPLTTDSYFKFSLHFKYFYFLILSVVFSAAGGWIDQPWVSEIHPGSVVVVQIWSDWVWNEVMKYKDYSGAITSGSGGGYIVIASEDDIEDAVKIRVRY